MSRVGGLAQQFALDVRRDGEVGTACVDERGHVHLVRDQGPVPPRRVAPEIVQAGAARHPNAADPGFGPCCGSGNGRRWADCRNRRACRAASHLRDGTATRPAAPDSPLPAGQRSWCRLSEELEMSSASRLAVRGAEARYRNAARRRPVQATLVAARADDCRDRDAGCREQVVDVPAPLLPSA